MQTPLVTLLTDFGEGSHYVAQMKGVLLQRVPHATIVDLAHNVAAQRIEQAAWLLRCSYRYFPANTCHISVVDPGVGTDRKILLVHAGGHFFIAPDNGLLTPTLEELPVETIRSIEDPRWWHHPVSSTFHGRDIMASCAGHLLRGVPLDAFGPPLSPARMARPLTSLGPSHLPGTAGTWRGAIQWVDAFGNLLSDLELPPNLAPEQVQSIRLPNSGIQIDRFVQTYGDCPPGTLVGLRGSNECLEIALVQGNAARQLHVNVGAPVELAFA